MLRLAPSDIVETSFHSVATKTTNQMLLISLYNADGMYACTYASMYSMYARTDTSLLRTDELCPNDVCIKEVPLYMNRPTL